MLDSRSFGRPLVGRVRSDCSAIGARPEHHHSAVGPDAFRSVLHRHDRRRHRQRRRDDRRRQCERRATRAAATTTASGARSIFGFTLNFFGTDYTQFFANNNGNISFGERHLGLHPRGPTGATSPVISPYFADVDTRGALSGVLYTAHRHRQRGHPDLGQRRLLRQPRRQAEQLPARRPRARLLGPERRRHDRLLLQGHAVDRHRHEHDRGGRLRRWRRQLGSSRGLQHRHDQRRGRQSVHLVRPEPRRRADFARAGAGDVCASRCRSRGARRSRAASAAHSVLTSSPARRRRRRRARERRFRRRRGRRARPPRRPRCRRPPPT